MKDFKIYLSEGIVKKRSPDLSRANFLIKESEKSFAFLKKMTDKIGIDNDGANSIVKICYDIIMESIRAEMLKQGYSASGQGAHEAEVAFAKELGLSSTELIFLDELRFLRNGIMYYGKIIDQEYAEKTIKYIEKIIPKIKNSRK